MDISAKDVEAFGRVLREIGELCERDPQRVLDSLLGLKGTIQPRKTVARSVKVDELERLDLFEIVKDKSRDDLMMFFAQYNVEQLRYLIRRYRLGALKSKSWKTLAGHLIDQLLKRRVDVFKTHES